MGHFNFNTLRRAVGHEMFYAIVAELDPANTAAWLQMVEVQRTFYLGESDYGDAARTYSESMRHTLHWAIVFILEDPDLRVRAQESEGGLMGYFVRLHPTAFKANGACDLSWGDSFDVLGNTHESMKTMGNVWSLTQGAWDDEEYEVARWAADHVRSLREASGRPVTSDGYGTPPRTTTRRRRMIQSGAASQYGG